MLQRCNNPKAGWAGKPKNIKHGEKMQEKTKIYIKDLIDDASIEANTIEMTLNDIQKSLSKMRKFYDKVIKDL